MQSNVALDFLRAPSHSVTMKTLLLAMLVLATPLKAQTLGIGPETGSPLPRFESLKFNKVNLRRGAGEDYPIAWTFQLYGLPVQIFQEFKDWRHVRDHDGATGWMHKSQLGTARTALVREDITDMRGEPDEAAKIVARVQPGVVLRFIQCKLDWCRVKVEGYRGWVRKDGLWGVQPEDVFGDD